MQPGISSYTYTWAVGVKDSMPARPLSAFDLVNKAYAAGIKVVQIADNLPLESWPDEQLLDLFSYASGRQVIIEAGGRGLTPGHTTECLLAAEKLGSPILRMVTDAPGYEPDLDSLISVVKELVPEFKSRRIRLAIENHDRLRAREFEKIILSTGSEWVGICLDSVNSMGAGEGFETVSEILLPYTFNLHLKDFSVRRVSHKMGFVIEGRPAGRGMLNIPDLVSKASRTGLCKSAILELWTPPEASIEETLLKENEWAEESLIYLKSVIH